MAKSSAQYAGPQSPAPLKGKVAIVTGAARGIGRAYALRLARLGADVAVVDIDLAGAAKFSEALSAPTVADEIKAYGCRGIGVQADLGDRASAQAMVQRTKDELGRVDILVNNAGGLSRRSSGAKPPSFPTKTSRSSSMPTCTA